MLGLDLVASGLLFLAGSNIQCTLPKAPEIVITPVSAEVQYNYSYTSQQLGQLKTDTISPYAAGTDTATGGLRHDQPQIETKVQWGVATYKQMGVSCLWYDKIEVRITLNPVIYIAKDQSGASCRKAITAHELTHVKVDRDVINGYARDIGGVVKQAVDDVGALGPYHTEDIENIRAQMAKHVEAAVESRTLIMEREMKRLQGQVDSLKEYERISKICAEER